MGANNGGGVAAGLLGTLCSESGHHGYALLRSPSNTSLVHAGAKLSHPTRLGITATMRAAETAVLTRAEEALSPSRLEELNAAKGHSLFIAGAYPKHDWTQEVGFVPDQQMFYQVTVGIAVDEGQRPNILAKVLISRDASSDFCHIVWEPVP